MKTLLIVILFLPSLVFAEVHKCKEGGKTVYSAFPCENGSVAAPYDPERTSISQGGIDALVTTIPIVRGRFLLDGSVEGKKTVWHIDTGATSTAITGALASQLGIKACVSYGMSVTAGGTVPSCRAKVDRLTVGGYHFNNVLVTIVPAMSGDSLLGQDILSNFSLSQRGGFMTLSR